MFGILTSFLSPLHLFAAGQCADKNFLGLLPWYHYVPLNSSCGFNVPSASDPNPPFQFIMLGAHSTLLLVGLAIVDDLLRIAGVLAVIYIIYAGIMFITSQGAPDAAAKARSAIINALVGLAISVVAIAFVSYVGGQLSGPTNTSSLGTIDISPLPNPTGVANGSIIQTILSIVFALIGAVSLVIIVLGGLQYVTSQGDPQAVTKAKNTIVYALIGLVVAILAQTLVTLVISKL